MDKLPQILMADRMIVGRLDSLKELHAVFGIGPSEPVKSTTIHHKQDTVTE
jgi:hypothetical protein